MDRKDFVENYMQAKVFEYFCKAEIYSFGECFVISSKTISEQLKISRYKARKAIHEFVSLGYLKRASQGCPAVESFGEYRELVCDAMPPINGYALTKKARNHPTYILIEEARNKELAEMCKQKGGNNEESKNTPSRMRAENAANNAFSTANGTAGNQYRRHCEKVNGAACDESLPNLLF